MTKETFSSSSESEGVPFEHSPDRHLSVQFIGVRREQLLDQSTIIMIAFDIFFAHARTSNRFNRMSIALDDFSEPPLSNSEGRERTSLPFPRSVWTL